MTGFALRLDGCADLRAVIALVRDDRSTCGSLAISSGAIVQPLTCNLVRLRPMLVTEQQLGHRKLVLLLYESFNNTGFLPNHKILDQNVNRPQRGQQIETIDLAFIGQCSSSRNGG